MKDLFLRRGMAQPKGAQYCVNRWPYAGNVFRMTLSRS